MSCADIFLGLIAILFPPIAVWIKVGLCTADSFINIALCCLGYLPGLIHAWYIIARHPERDYDQYHYAAVGDGGERGDRTTHYYIAHQQGTGGRNYGTQGHSQQQPQLPRKPAHPQRGIAPPPQQAALAGGSSSDPTAQPPSYSDVVKGDHKVQTAD